MHVIQARNVNDAYAAALRYLQQYGTLEDSRNGPVLVAPGPVTTVYVKPCERVLFSPLRNANPFFHFFEALWMLAGRNDIAFPVQFNKRFVEYSDDGVTQPAAYGHRWRTHFNYDQLQMLATELKRDPNTRRAVLAMWDATPVIEQIPRRYIAGAGDLHRSAKGTKDTPCNTHAYFDVRGGLLNMTVCCRSNDIVWGAYGANAVHFSMLQEYMAAWVGVPVGVYRQMSNNFHLYTSVVPMAKIEELAEDAAHYNFYRTGAVEPMPMVQVSVDKFDSSLHRLFAYVEDGGIPPVYTEPLFQQVAHPMRLAWQAHKHRDYNNALRHAGSIPAADWRVGCMAWLQRMATAYTAKQAT